MAKRETLTSMPKPELGKLVKTVTHPTQPGTPMREAINVPASWVIGALPWPPTPMERHVPSAPMTNPDAMDRLRRAFRALGIKPKHNPTLVEMLGSARRRSNPAGTMDEARRESQEFHGSPRFAEVGPDGKPKVRMGAIPDIDYDVPAGSERRGAWNHEIGDDLGPLGIHVKRKVKKPELAIDVATGKAEIHYHGAPLTFDPKAGLRK